MGVADSEQLLIGREPYGEDSRAVSEVNEAEFLGRPYVREIGVAATRNAISAQIHNIESGRQRLVERVIAERRRTPQAA